MGSARAARWAMVAGGSAVFGLGAIVAAGRTTGVDRALLQAAAALPDPLEGPLSVVMQLGSLPGALVAAAVCGVVTRRWAPALQVAVAAQLTFVAMRAAKRWIERPRPRAADLHEAPRVLATSFSYPSGHAAVAAAVATTMALVLPRPWRMAALAGLALTALARVYLGVHFPLDVLGGAGLGVAVAAVVDLGARALAARVPPRSAVSAGGEAP